MIKLVISSIEMALHWSIKFLPLLLILAFAISISLILLDQIQSSINEKIEVEFIRESSIFFSSLENQLNSIIGIEKTFNNHFIINPENTLSEFNSLASNLNEQMIDIRAIGYAPVIYSNDFDTFISEALNIYNDTFNILDFTTRDITKNIREIYTPLLFNRVFPRASNLGVDLYNSSSIRISLDKANKTCERVFTNPIKSLVDGSVFISIYDPVYPLEYENLNCSEKQKYLKAFTSVLIIPSRIILQSFESFSTNGLFIEIKQKNNEFKLASLVKENNEVISKNKEDLKFDGLNLIQELNYGETWIVETKSTFKFKETERIINFAPIIILDIVIILLGIFMVIGLFYWDNQNTIKENNIKKGELDKIYSYTFHEIRNPLNSILLGAKILKKNKDKDKDIKKYILESFEKSSEQAVRILDGMLAISKIEQNDFVHEMIYFNIDTIIRELINVYLYSMKEKEQHIEINIKDDVYNKYIYGNYSLLTQSLGNFLFNAIKYSDINKKIVIKIDIKKSDKFKDIENIENFHADEEIYFEVKDEGIGIKDKDKDKIFKPFVQINNEKKQEVGTGIGLIITKKFIEFHKGFIGFESKYNKGSTFHFSIPAIYKDFTTEFKKLTTEDIVSLYTRINVTSNYIDPYVDEEKGYKSDGVLVVEDNKDNKVFLTTILQTEGFEVDSCDNGLEALKKIQAGRKYKVILMDNLMIPMDGVRATKEILKINPEITVFGTTGLTSKKDIDNFVNAGAKKVFSKPLEFTELIKEIKNVNPEID